MTTYPKKNLTAVAGLVALVGMIWGGAACSSSPSSTSATEPPASASTVQPEASTTVTTEPEPDPSALTVEQRTALQEAADAYDEAAQVLVDSFDSEAVVPKLERWHEVEILHQEALVELRNALPDGECRAAIDALLVVEDGQNTIRLRLTENYRQNEFALVADGAVEYGVSVVNGALQAEEEVAVACGRSSVDPSRPPTDTESFTPDQTALFDVVVAAYAETRVAFDAVFSVEKFLIDLEALQEADAVAATELDEVVALLGEGECRTALAELRAIERKQATLREEMITAGQQNDLVAMLRVLGDYTEVNSSSEPFVTARQTAVDSCGSEI